MVGSYCGQQGCWGPTAGSWKLLALSSAALGDSGPVPPSKQALPLPPSCPQLHPGLALSGYLCLPQGTLEGFKVETADLKETLAGKEDSEHRLVLELESLRRQLQQAAQEQAALREECTRLWSRGEATATDAEAREAGKERGIWRSVQAVGRGYSCHGFPSSRGRSVSLEGQV